MRLKRTLAAFLAAAQVALAPGIEGRQAAAQKTITVDVPVTPGSGSAGAAGQASLPGALPESNGISLGPGLPQSVVSPAPRAQAAAAAPATLPATASVGSVSGVGPALPVVTGHVEEQPGDGALRDAAAQIVKPAMRPAPEEEDSASQAGPTVRAAAVVAELGRNEAVREIRAPQTGADMTKLGALFERSGRPRARDYGGEEPARPRSSKRLSRAFGGLRLGFGDKTDAPWRELERWLSEELGLKLGAGKTEEWAAATANLLRNRPETAVEHAVARALGELHGLAPEAAVLAKKLLSGTPVIDARSPSPLELHVAGERTYAFASGGLSLWREGKWRALDVPDLDASRGVAQDGDKLLVSSAGDVLEVDGESKRVVIRGVGSIGPRVVHGGRAYLLDGGKGVVYREAKPGHWEPVPSSERLFRDIVASEDGLFAAADDGIFKWSGEGWKRVFAGPKPLAMVAHAGRLFAMLSGVTVYVEILKGRARRLWLPEHGRARELLSIAGRLYVVSEKFETFEWAAGGWELVAPQPRQIIDWKILGEELLAQAHDGVYLVRDGNWRRIGGRVGMMRDVARSGARRYVATDTGVYEIHDDHLVPVVTGMEVYKLALEGDRMLLVTDRGILRRDEFPAGLGPGWREGILADVERRLELASRRRAPTAAAEAPGSGDAGGAVVDEEGRSLFRGMTATLATALGSLRLGFGDKARPAKGDADEEPEDLSTLAVEDQLEVLMDRHQVPPADRALRRKLTLEAVARIRTDIPLIADNPELPVRFGPWWLTDQDLADPRLKEILIPLEDIFKRAVDPGGVQEAIGAAIHEISHFMITRADPASPLTAKYLLTSSPEANNALYQALEDVRINTWAQLRRPGISPYFDAIYEAMWPEDPEAKIRLEKRRAEALARSTVKVTMPGRGSFDYMPPHLQYVNSIVYRWRHGKNPPFLKDSMALEAFEKTFPALERVRNAHPKELGGILIEEAKKRASREALEITDREIFPFYDQLLRESDRQMGQMQQGGGNMTSNKGDGGKSSNGGKPQQGGDGDSMEGKEGEPSSGGGSQKGGSPRDVREQLDKDLAEYLRGHGHDEKNEARRNGWKPAGDGKPAAAGTEGQEPGDGDDNSWLKRREKAIEQERARLAAATTYERYKLRAAQLGLINQVDGMVKRLLRPTKHSRLSRTLYHEGDEPDMNQYYDDAAQGRFDTPIMRRWNRRIRRSAKISLALDISGSMGSLTASMDSPLDNALIAVAAWIEVCQKNDLDFEVMLFDTAQHFVHRFNKTVNREEKEKIVAAIASKSGGSTAIGAAFKAALDSLLKQQATHRFVIFATDEGHNTGDAPETWMPEARRNKVVTIAMVIGAEGEGYQKHFDYAVRVKEAKDFPRELLGVLQKAIRIILGPYGAALQLVLALAPALAGAWVR